MPLAALPRPVAFDFDGFKSDNASPKSGTSPVRSRLEQWSPNRSINTSQKLDAATARREGVLEHKKSLAHHESRADAVKRREAETATKLQYEIEAKVSAARARAEVSKKDAARKGSKMSEKKVTDLRREEEASIALTKELNEKRHKEALARAKDAKMQKAKKGEEMSNTPKAEAAKLKSKEETAKLKEESALKMCAALARAESAKKETALKGKKEAEKVEVRRAIVFEDLEADAKAKAKAMQERLEKSGRNAEEFKAHKVDKAARMASPGKRALAPPGSAFGWFETPAAVAFEVEGIKTADTANDSGCASPVRARLEQWTPKRAKQQAEVDAKVAAAQARAEALKAEAVLKATKMGDQAKAEAAKLKSKEDGELKAKALSARIEGAVARADELKADRVEKATRMATPKGKRERDAAPTAGSPGQSDHFECPPPPDLAAAVMPPPPGAEDLVTSILEQDAPRSRSPSPAKEAPAGAGLKVTTLRRDSPGGSHVISVVTPIPPDEARDRDSPASNEAFEVVSKDEAAPKVGSASPEPDVNAKKSDVDEDAAAAATPTQTEASADAPAPPAEGGIGGFFKNLFSPK